MTNEIKQHIYMINRGEVPQGYKKTKVGIVPIEWEVKKPLDFAPLQRGFDLPSQLVEKGIYPICCSNGITGHHKEFKVDGPGIYTGRSGTIGKVFFINERYWPHNTALWVTKFNGVIPKFVFYLYVFIDFSKYNAGSTVPTLNRNDIHVLNVAIPPIIEQEKIVKILTTCDTVLELKEKLIAEKQKQKKWLMQNLLTGKKRLKGFSEKWKKVKLGEISTVFSGGTPLTSQPLYYKGAIPFIRSAEIDKRETELFISELGLQNSSTKLVNKGDLLYALYGANSGECAISKIDGAINQAILCIRNSYVNLLYLYYILFNSKDDIVSTYLQGGQGNLSGEIIKNLKILIPPKTEQIAIAEILSTVDREIELLQQDLNQWKNKKKALMQLLLTGKVRLNI